ncbi:MAG: hypothetical protein ACOCZQ_03255 [Nanoarchaeota archaeon]
MSIDEYCGIQESRKGWFFPLYVNSLGTSVSPRSQEELSELARHDSRFVYEFAEKVLEGKRFWCDGVLSKKETGKILLETIISRFEYFYLGNSMESNNSFEPLFFYKILDALSGVVDTKPYLKRYEGYMENKFKSTSFKGGI